MRGCKRRESALKQAADQRVHAGIESVDMK